MQAKTASVREMVSAEEWQTRVDLAAAYRLAAHYGWDDLVFTHISSRVPGPDHHFLINPCEDRPARQQGRGKSIFRQPCRLHHSQCGPRGSRRRVVRDAPSYCVRHRCFCEEARAASDLAAVAIRAGLDRLPRLRRPRAE